MTEVAGTRKDKLKYLKISDITCEDRAREDLGTEEQWEEFKKSISEKGVLQPITVSSDLKLLAGGRRFTACSELGILTIPAIVRAVEDTIDEKEIELIENIHRKDFTWQERARLTAEIDVLYRRKYPDWNLRKTAEVSDRSLAQSSRDIQLATAMQVIPEIREAKTADEALKMVKKLEERAITAELARRQQDRVEATSGTAKGLDKAIVDTVKMAGGNYIIGSCFDGLAKLKTNSSINIIECDPPYGIDLQDQKGDDALVGNSVGYKEVSRDHYPEFLATLTKELYRVAGKDCWLIFWFGPTWQAEVLRSLREAGWLVDEIPAIWTKPQGQTLQPELYYARCYEPFYLARKGKPVMAERGHSNVFSFNGSKDKYHPTQRPVDLIEEIFNTLHVGTGTVLVPFLGSGATLRACYNLGLSGFGWDLDGKYKDKFLLAVEEDVRRLFKE